jgi:hypothetical protein
VGWGILVNNVQLDRTISSCHKSSSLASLEYLVLWISPVQCFCKLTPSVLVSIGLQVSSSLLIVGKLSQMVYVNTSICSSTTVTTRRILRCSKSLVLSDTERMLSCNLKRLQSTGIGILSSSLLIIVLYLNCYTSCLISVCSVTSVAISSVSPLAQKILSSKYVHFERCRKDAFRNLKGSKSTSSTRDVFGLPIRVV